MAEPTYDEVLKASLNSKLLLYRQVISSFMIKFLCNVEVPFSTMIFFMMNLVKSSYQDKLDHFFKAIFRFDVAKRIVTKAALTKAGMKLKYEVCGGPQYQPVTGD